MLIGTMLWGWAGWRGLSQGCRSAPLSDSEALGVLVFVLMWGAVGPIPMVGLGMIAMVAKRSSPAARRIQPGRPG
jgi:hypothetical protein